MRKRRVLLPATVLVGFMLSFAALATGEPPAPASFTDMTVPTTRVTTTFTDANGDAVTKTTIDGHFTSVVNGVTGPFHTTIFRIAHAATGKSDTTGVDFAHVTCVVHGWEVTGIDVQTTGIGVTGSVTHTDLVGQRQAGISLWNDRGTFTTGSPGDGGVTTDSGVLAKSLCISDNHHGPLVIASPAIASEASLRHQA